MKKILVTYVLFMFFFTTCKKKDTVCEVAEETNTLVNTSLENGFGKNVNNLHGVMLLRKETFLYNFNVVNNCFASLSYNGKALFNYYNSYGNMSNTGANAGQLKLNGVSLKYEVAYPTYVNTYLDSSGTIKYDNGFNWNFSASPCCLSSFNANITRDFPLTKPTPYLPDTISKAAGFIINFGLNNQSNTDSINVFLVGPSAANTFSYITITKRVLGNVSSVSYSPAELSNFYSGGGSTIYIYSTNYANLTVNSKNYLFVMRHNITNFLVIKP